jgi:hypothetical protein
MGSVVARNVCLPDQSCSRRFDDEASLFFVGPEERCASVPILPELPTSHPKSLSRSRYPRVPCAPILQRSDLSIPWPSTYVSPQTGVQRIGHDSGLGLASIEHLRDGVEVDL